MCDKAFNIVKNPKNDGYPSMVHKFVDKKTSARANKKWNHI